MAEVVKILAGCKSVITAHCMQSTECPGFAFVFWEQYPQRTKASPGQNQDLPLSDSCGRNRKLGSLARILPRRVASVKCFRSPLRGAANRHGETCGYAYTPIYSRSDCSAPIIPSSERPVPKLFASWFPAAAVRCCAKRLSCLTTPKDRAYRDANA